MTTRYIWTSILAVMLLAAPLYAEVKDSDVVAQSPDISGGVNEFDRESLIGEDESTVLKNAIVRKKGIVEKRDGVNELRYDDASGGFLLLSDGSSRLLLSDGASRILIDSSSGDLNTTVNALAHYYKLGDTTRRLLIQYGNKLDVWDGTTFTYEVFTDLSVSGECEIFTAGDYAWFVSPNMATRAYNFTDLTQSGGAVNDPPDSAAGLYHKGRVLLWGNSSNRDYIWWSGVGPDMADLFVFDRTTNAIKVDSGDNQELVALVEYGLTGIPSLIALKENSIYQIDTSEADPADWSVIKLISGYGCVARRTAIAVNNEVIFLCRDGGQYKVMTLSRTIQDKINIGEVPLSNRIKNLLSDVSDSYMKYSCATFYDGYYILSFPSGSSTYNDKTVVYDTQTQSWVEWTGITPSQFATFLVDNEEDLYFGNDDDETKLFRAFDGNDDDGTAITYQEESRAWDMGFPHHNKVWKNLEVEFDGVAEHKYIDIYAKLDEGGWTQLYDGLGNNLDLYVPSPTLPIQLPFSLADTGVIRQTYDLSQLGQGRIFKWKIINADTDFGSDMKRLGVYLRAYVNPQEWEGVQK